MIIVTISMSIKLGEKCAFVVSNGHIWGDGDCFLSLGNCLGVGVKFLRTLKAVVISDGEDFAEEVEHLRRSLSQVPP